jgi:PKD repeat protein
MGSWRRYTWLVVVAVLALLGLVIAPTAASATPGDVGIQGPSYVGVSNPPTSDKPQSKLWITDGIWFADMFDTVSKTWHIFRLDRATQSWVDTGVMIDNRPATLADTLWDGSHLYVASHVATVSSNTSARVSQPGNPARLYRFSYNSATKSFALDAGFPTIINTQSSESMTLDKDSTGTVWATWTQVSGNSTSGFTSAVYVNSTVGGDSAWGTPFVLPVAGANPAFDDISAIVAFGRNRIGVLWSNQSDDTVYWAVHNDGAAPGDWRGMPAIRGNGQADDHLNIKALQADQAGRVFAAVKTSADDIAGTPSSAPQILLLVFKPGTGAWSATTFGTLADCHTRPQVVLDEQNSVVYVLATAPTGSGCPFSGAAGSIYMKSAPMDNPVFAPGRGTAVITDAASPNVNDVTTTKQPVNNAVGLVALASNNVTKRYWHADIPVGGGAPPPPPPAAPVASFTASPTSGTAPLAVQFTDTSTGTPTSWAWNFGDGGTATTQNPAHTFSTAGTFTVTLAATNAGETSATATKTVTVTAPPPPPSGSAVTAGPSVTAVNINLVTDVVVPRPTGIATGDVLVAQVTADNNPDLSGVPTGWTAVLSPVSVTTGARVFVYYHVVSDAAAEPASYTWTLSTPQRWGAVMGSFHGVDPANPFDTVATTKKDTTYAAAQLTVPGVTTATAGAMLVGGVGLDNRTVSINPPTGWTEFGESSTGQMAELAYQARPTAGATGSATWTLTAAAGSGGWIRALRPAPAA